MSKDQVVQIRVVNRARKHQIIAGCIIFIIAIVSSIGVLTPRTWSEEPAHMPFFTILLLSTLPGIVLVAIYPLFFRGDKVTVIHIERKVHREIVRSAVEGLAYAVFIVVLRNLLWWILSPHLPLGFTLSALDIVLLISLPIIGYAATNRTRFALSEEGVVTGFYGRKFRLLRWSRWRMYKVDEQKNTIELIGRGTRNIKVNACVLKFSSREGFEKGKQLIAKHFLPRIPSA